MNRTKRKIFEISMDLFASKGYDATSIEEITSVVGIAKGTLYYHFSSKQEILDFLIEEGLKLLEHSLETKARQNQNIEDKIYAMILVELKVVSKYESLISIVINEICGNETRNQKCRKCVFDCVTVIENVLKEAVLKKEIIECDTKLLSFQIFSIICSHVMLNYNCKENIDMVQSAKKYTNTIVSGIINKK